MSHPPSRRRYGGQGANPESFWGNIQNAQGDHGFGGNCAGLCRSMAPLPVAALQGRAFSLSKKDVMDQKDANGGREDVDMWRFMNAMRCGRSDGQVARRIGLAARATRSEWGGAGFRRVCPDFFGAVAHLFTYCHRCSLVAALFTKKYFSRANAAQGPRRKAARALATFLRLFALICGCFGNFLFWRSANQPRREVLIKRIAR